jgi:hypothetical protein
MLEPLFDNDTTLKRLSLCSMLHKSFVTLLPFFCISLSHWTSGKKKNAPVLRRRRSSHLIAKDYFFTTSFLVTTVLSVAKFTV